MANKIKSFKVKVNRRSIMALGAKMRRAPVFKDKRATADWREEDWATGDDLTDADFDALESADGGMA